MEYTATTHEHKWNKQIYFKIDRRVLFKPTIKIVDLFLLEFSFIFHRKSFSKLKADFIKITHLVISIILPFFFLAFLNFSQS